MEMEKSVGVRNGKVSSYIPNDLDFPILSKLPLKSLKRFGCARKSWALLFENPYFMSMLCKNFLSNNHSYNDDTSLLLNFHFKSIFYDSNCVLYSLSGERFDNSSKLNWPNPLQEENHRGFDILGSGSINGIICLTTFFQPKPRVVLWNPTTEEFKVVPPGPHELVPYIDVVVDRHEFGYDCVRHDYKVIQRVTFDIKELPLGGVSYDLFWEIYSLQGNSWRKLDANIPYYDDEDQGVYIDGVCHWWSESETNNGDAYLVSFDFSNEAFFTTPMPSNMDASFDSGLVWRQLAVLRGSIALISNYAEMPTFRISILGELGVNESWSKLFIVGPLPYIEHPIRVGKKGDKLFVNEDGILAYFDFSNQIIEQLGFAGEICYKLVTYKESLLPIGEIDN